MSHQKLPNGYWTDEKVIEESRKYHTRIEFKQNAPTACKLAYQRKLIDKMIWLKTDRHKKRGPRKEQKYTKDVILSIVEQNNCVTITDLRLLNEYAYNQAKKNGWLDDLGLIRPKHENGFWTKKEVLKMAKKYPSKMDFQKNEPTAYKWACEYGILDKMEWMKPHNYDERKDEHNSVVYAYLDEENKVAYVGLTIDSNSRKRSHKYDSNSAVRKYFGESIPEPIVLKENLTVLESQYYEDIYKKQYAEDGYQLLNVAATGINTGSTGGIAKWTSKEKVFEESKKYHTRSEF